MFTSDDTRLVQWRLEMLIQLCRIQVQRERENLMAMSPKMRGALDSLKQLQSHVDDESEKLTRRIHDEVIPKITGQFSKAHGDVDTMITSVDDISNFGDTIEGMGHNGGDPLEGSGKPSPRSSEVASK